MKVVGMSNYAKENIEEKLIAENVSMEYARELVEKMNKEVREGDTYFYVVKPDNYRLWRGMEDLV